MADDDDAVISAILAQLAASAPGARNSILAGQGTLIRQMIQSPNFITGVSGWTINKDGSAEFNNLTIRGTFAGTNFVINANGIFFYSGVPATGNLVLALTNSAGTDAFGNVYIQGITIGNNSGVQVLLRIVTGVQAAMQFPTNNPNENVAANITANAGGGVTLLGFLQLVISGPKTNVAGNQDWTQILFNSANYGGTSNASLDIIYIGTGGGVHTYAFMDGSGFNITAGSIVAAKPGAIPQVPETWTTLALINGYTSGANPGGFVDVPQVRLMADNKTLGFKGQLVVPAGPASGIFAAMPTGYPNANLGGNFGMGLVANLSGGTVDHIQVQNNGNISLHNFSTEGTINFNITCQIPTQ
jgi:hypothetical protein